MSKQLAYAIRSNQKRSDDLDQKQHQLNRKELVLNIWTLVQAVMIIAYAIVISKVSSLEAKEQIEIIMLISLCFSWVIAHGILYFIEYNKK